MPSITLSALAEHLGAELVGDNNAVVIGLNTLEKANPDEVGFLAIKSIVLSWKQLKP